MAAARQATTSVPGKGRVGTRHRWVPEQERREAFANDPVDLWPVEASLSRTKGARGPDEWVPLPGSASMQTRFMRILIKYELMPLRPRHGS